MADSADGSTRNSVPVRGAKRHHYLPRMYLKGFASNGLLAVYDRSKGDVRLQAAHNTALARHLYTLEDDEGHKRFDLEELLSGIESKMAVSIPRLLAGSFDGDDIDTLIGFTAFLEVRTPGALEAAKQVKAEFVNTTLQMVTLTPERARRALAAVYRHDGTSRTEEQLTNETQRIVEFVKSGRYDLRVDDQYALIQSFKLWETIYKALKERDVLFVRPEDPLSRYITCDAPVILEGTSGGSSVGFGSPDAKIMLPLTADCMVAFEGKGSRIGQASESAEHVAWVNEMLVRSAQRYAIASDEQQLRELTGRLGLHGTVPHPRYVTGATFDDGGAVGYVRRVLPHRLAPRSGNPMTQNGIATDG